MALLPDHISKKRPTGVLLASALLFCVPFILIGMLFYGYHKGLAINWRLQTVVALASVVSWVTSFGVVKVKQWGYFVLFTIFALTLAVDIQHIVLAPQSFNLWDLVDFTFVTVGVVVFLIKRNRGVYFDPKMRWWDRAPRFKTNLIGEFTFEKKTFQLPVIIISKSGCFATYDDKIGLHLERGDTLKVTLKLENVTFESKVRVVTGRNDRHGYGMGFVNMSTESKKTIKQLIKLVRPRFKLNNQVA